MTKKETIEYFEYMTDPLDHSAYELCPCFDDHYEMAKIALEALKAQKEGLWIAEEDEYRICATEFTCSICGKTFCSSELTDSEFYEMMKYCCNCGARMSEVTE